MCVYASACDDNRMKNTKAKQMGINYLRTVYAVTLIAVTLCCVILMNICRFKKFVPFHQVKYEGVTYTHM